MLWRWISLCVKTHRQCCLYRLYRVSNLLLMAACNLGGRYYPKSAHRIKKKKKNPTALKCTDSRMQFGTRLQRRTNGLSVVIFSSLRLSSGLYLSQCHSHAARHAFHTPGTLLDAETGIMIVIFFFFFKAAGPAQR